MSMPPTPPGWYQDPEAPSHERWWDGTAWTPHTRVAQALAVGHGPAPADPAQHTGQFGPPAPTATGGMGPSGGRGKLVALVAAGVVLVASIVTGVVVLGKDDKSDPGASTRTSPSAQATSPDDKPEPTRTEPSGPAETDAKVLEDQLNGITLPIPEGWEKPDNTVEKAVTMTTEGTYPCPGDAGFCHHGRVTSRTVRDGAGEDPEVAAKTDISEAAKRSYDRDVIDRRPYNGITSHQELKAEPVVVAGSTGYLMRWRVKTEAGEGGYVQSVVFPKPGSDALIVVRFAFDAEDGPPLSLMDEITKGIGRIGDTGGTNGGVGSTIEPS